MLASCANTLFPAYNGNEMCYFFASVIFEAAMEIWNVASTPGPDIEFMGRPRSSLVHGRLGQPKPSDLARLITAYREARPRFVIVTAEDEEQRRMAEEQRHLEEIAQERSRRQAAEAEVARLQRRLAAVSVDN